MISQEEIGFESSGESRVSPPKQRPSVQAVHVAAAHAPGALIYDPASGSLRYPKFTQLPGGGLKSDKGGVNAAIPIQASTGSSSASGSFCKKNSSSGLAAGEKHIGLRSAHGVIYDHQSAESSPRCVIVNSILESSTSTSPSGSKSVSEMDDYSDVKQLITHNRSSSPSDAEEDTFFASSNSQKSLAASGFRSLDATRGDNPPRQKNVKGNGEQLAQKIYQVAGNHSRSISTSSVPGSDSFQKLATRGHGAQQRQQEALEVESAYGSSGSLGSSNAFAGALSNPSAAAAMLDSGSHTGGVRSKSRGESGPRGSQSHELLTLKDNGWDGGEHAGGGHLIQTVSEPGVKNSPLDPILESLMKASVMKDATQFKYQQNQIAEKIEEMKRKNGMKLSVQSSTFSHGGAGAFSFNQTHFVRVNDADFLDYDSNYDTASNSSFDFNRGGGGGGGGGENIKGVQRTVLTNFAKPTPSKWDDAEKWLSSEPPVKVKSKSGPQGHPLSAQGALVVSKKAAFLNQAGRLIPNITQLAKVDASSGGGGAPGTNSGGSSEVSSSSSTTGTSMGNEGEEVMLISADQHQSLSMPTKGERTKKIDATANSFVSKSIDNHEQSDATGASARFAFLSAAAGPAGPAGPALVLQQQQQQQQQQPHSPRANANSVDRYPVDDPFQRDNGAANEESTPPDPARLGLLDPALRTEKPTSDSPAKHDSLPKVEVAAPEQPVPAEAAPKVCMRDMGTAMTPVASVEPSRAPTPVSARTPTLRSPSSSRPATPSRVVPASSPISETEKKIHYTDKELQSKTRQEILALGTQLGKHNIAAWATKEEEEEDAFKSLKSNVDLEEVRKVMIATRAAAWEEAEQSKYMARFKREEAKIVAWENHEKAKAEAEIRRTEMKIERMRSHANEKLMNKLASTRRSAEELRASAAARRGEQASKTSQRAEYIRRTGKVPSSLFASLCCS